MVVVNCSLLALTLLLLSHLTVSKSLNCSISVSEYNALYSFYTATSGPHWTYPTASEVHKWIFTTNNYSSPCSLPWYGLSCEYISNSSSTACSIKVLALASMNLHGIIPSTISDLQSLQELILHDNRLYGTVPNTAISQLDYLNTLDLSYNDISGPFPSLPVNCSILYLSLNNNSLDSIESIVADNILFINADNNKLAGSLPMIVSKSLQHFNLSSNLFYCTLDNDVFVTPNIVSIDISRNYLYGSIPSFTYTRLRSVDLSYNNFNGTIPAFQTPILSQLTLSNNFLTGSLFELTASLLLSSGGRALKFLLLSRNLLSGSIVSSLIDGSFINLSVLDLSNNRLSGTLYDNTTSSSFQVLFLNYNQLVGEIPSSLIYHCNRTISYLDLSNNNFTGSIPLDIQYLTNLHTLDLHNNRLISSIPRLDTIVSLKYLDLSSNLLSGSMPYTLPENVTYFNVSYNSLSGNLDTLFDQQLQQLYSLDISSNAFTGLIPSNSFTPSLTFALYADNCFSGVIPDSVCRSRDVQVLVLDGASGGTQCTKLSSSFISFISSISSTSIDGFSKTSLTGTIPYCIFKFKKLNLLHLLGNGLTGYISEISQASLLDDLNLSYNELQGTIPTTIQSKSFDQIDLSYNRLNGILDLNAFREPTLNGKVNIAVNRLSGVLPTSLKELDSAVLISNVFNGNLFACFSSDYYSVCGSALYDISLYFYVSFSIFVAIVAVIISYLINANITHHRNKRSSVSSTSGIDSIISPDKYQFLTNVYRTYLQWFSTTLGIYYDTVKGMDNRIVQYIHLVSRCVLASALLTVFYVTVCLNTYWTIKINEDGKYRQLSDEAFSMITYQYGYVISSIYLKGWITVYLFAVFIIISVYLLQYLIKTSKIFTDATTSHDTLIDRVKRMHGNVTQISSKHVISYFSSRLLSSLIWPKIVLPTIIQAINMVVTISINALYIHAVIYTTSDLNTIQFFVAMFKIFWSCYYVPTAVKLLRRNGGRKNHLLFHYVSMSIFNYIIGPSVITLVTDDHCYSNLFKPVARIVVSFIHPVSTCETIVYADYILNTDALLNKVSVICSNANAVTTYSLLPPYRYSYECTSSIIKNYVPLYFYSYAFLTFILAPIKFIVYAVDENYFAPWGIFKVIRWANKYVFSHQMWTLNSKEDFTYINDDRSKKEYESSTPLLRNTDTIGLLFLHLAMQLTFGMSSPMLSIAITVYLCVEGIYQFSIFGRYLLSIDKYKLDRVKMIARMAQDTRISGTGIKLNLLFILLVAGLFWAYMTFDTVADAYGPDIGMKVSIGMLALYTLLFTSLIYIDKNNAYIRCIGQSSLALLKYMRFIEADNSGFSSSNSRSGGGSDMSSSSSSSSSSNGNSETAITKDGDSSGSRISDAVNVEFGSSDDDDYYHDYAADEAVVVTNPLAVMTEYDDDGVVDNGNEMVVRPSTRIIL